MNSIINNAFKHKNGGTRYTHIKVCRNKSYSTSDPLNSDNKCTADDIYKMIEFLVDNIYVRFGGQLFRQMVGIPWEKTVPHYWLTCFSIPMKMSFWINSLRKAKESLVESSIYHTVTSMTLSLLIIKDLRSSFPIFTPKNSQFLKPQNLLQLLLISICFSSEIIATI